MNEEKVAKEAEENAWLHYHDLLETLQFKRIPPEKHEFFLNKWLDEMSDRIKNRDGWHSEEKKDEN